MPLCHSQEFSVFHFECDPWDRMTPGAVLRRVQEISTGQCTFLGLDEELYKRTGTVFLLAKVSLQVLCRMPEIDEKITIETRAYGMRRAVYHRLTSLHSQNGTKLCEADARWVLVDTAARRILRRPLPEFAPFFTEQPKEEHQMEMPKPAQVQQLESFCAKYSLCDRNGHVNNTRYADILCDNLPIEKLEKAPPQKMIFSYHSEIALSQAFELCGANLEENQYYFAANSQKGKHFEGFAQF